MPSIDGATVTLGIQAGDGSAVVGQFLAPQPGIAPELEVVKGRVALARSAAAAVDVRPRIECVVVVARRGGSSSGAVKMPNVVGAIVYAGEDVVVMARLTAATGEYLTAEDVEEVNLELFATEGGTPDSEPSYSVGLVVEDVMQTAPQIDGAWRGGTPGYTFRHVLTGDALPTAGRRYVAAYRIKTAEHGIARLQAQISVAPTRARF